MSIIDSLFGRRADAKEQPKIAFGRYSDSYKTEKEYDAWDQALSLFEDEEYMKSYKQFFIYLNDDQQNNVEIEELDAEIYFKFYQGSEVIRGTATPTKLTARAKVARFEQLNIGMMRKLLERNFELKFCRFGVDNENTVFLLFDSYSVDASPYKLYYGLKELATTGDKLDDLLLDEFHGQKNDLAEAISPLDDREKEIKYQYLNEELDLAIKEAETGELDTTRYPAGVAFLLLALIYKLDFLIRPEGLMMETLERAHRLYYANNSDGAVEKNHDLLKEIKTLKSRKKADFYKELYGVRATFGITPSTSFTQLVGVIDTHLSQMDWYEEEGYDRVALSIPQFIVGHSLFNGAIPLPIRDLFILFYRVTEYTLFDQLGFEPSIVTISNSGLVISKKELRDEFRNIAKKYAGLYPNFNPSVSAIEFKNLIRFAKSFLLMIRSLDMTKK